MINYGNSVAKYVVQGQVNVSAGSWTPLQVGSTPKKDRTQVRISARSNPGLAIALAYSNINADGTFTAPTDTLANTTVYPGGRTWVEPVGEKVTVYGRLLNKAGATDGSAKVIVTEFC